MWTVLSKKLQLTIIVAATLIIWMGIEAALGLISGTSSSPLKYISLIVFLLASVAVAIFNRYWRAIWRRFPVLSKAVFPDLNGTWKGTLHSNWKHPVSGESPGPIENTVWIRQSLLSVSVIQQTRESPSWSTRTFLEVDAPSDRYRLWYSYTNEPHANVSATSPKHEGVCILEMDLALNNQSLNGQYYTSRATSGNMQIERFSTEPIDPPGRADWRSGSGTHEFRLRTNQ